MAKIIIDTNQRKILSSVNKDIEEYIKTLKVPTTFRSDGIIIIEDDKYVNKAQLKADLNLIEEN